MHGKKGDLSDCYPTEIIMEAGGLPASESVSTACTQTPVPEDVLQGLQRSQWEQRTVLLATHIVPDIEAIANEIIILLTECIG